MSAIAPEELALGTDRGSVGLFFRRVCARVLLLECASDMSPAKAFENGKAQHSAAATLLGTFQPRAKEEDLRDPYPPLLRACRSR